MLRIQSWLIETAPLAYYLTAALGSLYLLNCLFILLRLLRSAPDVLRSCRFRVLRCPYSASDTSRLPPRSRSY